MSNNTQMAEITELAKGLAKSAQQSDSGGGSFMKFTKFGEWTWGTEAAEVEDDALWAIHPQGFQHGWIAWGDKKHNNSGTKLGETMVAATEPLPFEKDLPVVEGSWAQQISMQLVCLNGMDKGTKVLFNSCSTGGRKVYHDIVNAVVAQITSGRQDISPVVKLDNDHYTHKEYGKIFTPVMDIESYKTLVELEAMLNSLDDEEAEETAAALSKVDEVEEVEESAEEMKARLKAEAKAELKAELAAEAKTAKPKEDSEVKAQRKAEALAEAKAEAKAEALAEAKAEAKAEALAEADAESEKARAKAQAKGEAKLAEEALKTDNKAKAEDVEAYKQKASDTEGETKTPRRRRRTPTA
mgnify:CR=1 FL=1